MAFSTPPLTTVASARVARNGRGRRIADVADGVCGREQLRGERTFMHLISAPGKLLISFKQFMGAGRALRMELG